MGLTPATKLSAVSLFNHRLERFPRLTLKTVLIRDDDHIFGLSGTALVCAHIPAVDY